MSTPNVQWYVFDGSQADAYEKFLVPAMFAPMAADLVVRAAPRSGERVLDIACGTGIVARIAADRVGSAGRVAGVDLNPSMLAVAARESSSSRHSIDWLEARAESVPLDAGSFDLILCQQGLQFFPDRLAALREMKRLLAQGGRVLISVWRDVGRGFDVLAGALGRHISADAGGALARGPASLRDGDELSALVQQAGFSGVGLETATVSMHFPSPVAFVQQYVNATPLAAAVARASQSDRDQLLDNVAENLRDLIGPDGLRFNGETNIATGIRE